MHASDFSHNVFVDVTFTKNAAIRKAVKGKQFTGIGCDIWI